MIEILFPAGRLVGGSLYQGQTKDDKGQPLVYKSGKNAGQPRTSYSFGVAYPKAGTTSWQQTEWGAKIFTEGQKTAEKFYQGRFFAWKVTDGDSAEPNKKGNKPCDREGYPGHWVVWFSGNFAPNLFNANGTERLTAPDAIKPGNWVQVFGNVEFNGNLESPGMYMNFSMVALSGYDPKGEIVLAAQADASEVGFGANLPTGISQVPVSAMSAPPPAPGAAVSSDFPPAGWAKHPTAAGYFFKDQEVLTEAELRAKFPAAPPAPVAAPAPPAPPSPPAAPPAPHTSYMEPPAPPAPPAAFPPTGWWAHPGVPGSFYNAQNEVLTEAQLRARG